MRCQSGLRCCGVWERYSHPESAAVTLSRASLIAILGVGLILTGCSFDFYRKEITSVSNSEGTLVAVLEVDGGGGATVDYRTDLKIARLPSPVFGGYRYVWTARSWIEVELKWITPTKLEVRYPATLEDRNVVRNETQWEDVEIVYTPVSQ